MATTNFVAGDTIIRASWLNDIDAAVYQALGDGSNNPPSTTAQVRTNLGFTDWSGSSLVGYRQAGTGAIATTVQTKLRDTISVLDFGGSTSAAAADNTTAFNNAYTYASATNGSVYVPAGTYAISGTVTGLFYSFGTVTITGGTVNSIRVLKYNASALATNATSGFEYMPTCAGTPSGAPTAITGYSPVVVDTTNNLMYFYSNSAWRQTGGAAITTFMATLAADVGDGISTGTGNGNTLDLFNAGGAGANWTAVINVGSAFADSGSNDGKFTAPSTGNYQFNAVLTLTGITAAMTSAKLYLNKGGTYVLMDQVHAYNVSDAGTLVVQGSTIQALTAADVVSLSVVVSNGAANSAVVEANSAPTYASQFSGFQIA